MRAACGLRLRARAAGARIAIVVRYTGQMTALRLARRCLAAASLLIAAAAGAPAQTPVWLPDIPATFVRPTTGFDYDKREVMIPMRDGVKLHTVIVVPKGATSAPIILTRTPYNASGRTARNQSASMLATLPQGDEVFVADGYIRVFQDVRGKYGSEGDYLMTRPLRGPLNPTETDHSTDAYDTIEWLVKHVARVERPRRDAGKLVRGLHGGDGAGESAPRAEGGRADEPDGRRLDGRRLVPLRRVPPAELRLLLLPDDRARRQAAPSCASGYDDYENFRRAGSAGDYAKANGLDQLPMWRKMSEHPAYDAVLAGAGARQDDGEAAA